LDFARPPRTSLSAASISASSTQRDTASTSRSLNFHMSFSTTYGSMPYTNDNAHSNRS